MSDKQMTDILFSENAQLLGRVVRSKAAEKNDSLYAIGVVAREAQKEVSKTVVHTEYELVKGLDTAFRLRQAYPEVMETPEQKEAAKQRDEVFAELLMRIEIAGCSQILEELVEMRQHLNNGSFKDKFLELTEW
jgi:hypothetical protein